MGLYTVGEPGSFMNYVKRWTLPAYAIVETKTLAKLGKSPFYYFEEQRYHPLALATITEAQKFCGLAAIVIGMT